MRRRKAGKLRPPKAVKKQKLRKARSPAGKTTTPTRAILLACGDKGKTGNSGNRNGYNLNIKSDVVPPSSSRISAPARGISPAQSYPIPYDEYLLERARTQWQFGDWDSLAKLDRDTLQHHPDRAKLALLVATGHLQTNNTSAVRQYIRLARDWGCGKKLVSQILIAGVHNSLGRAAAAAGQQTRALKHFESAITVGTPGSETRLLTQARAREQLGQIGLPTSAVALGVDAGKTTPTVPPPLPPLSRVIEDFNKTLRHQKAELDAQLKKQADELIRVRKFLDTVVKREVANAAKQIEAFVGLQSYFATGELPNVNTERHSWPISPDFALYLIELLETNNYDLVIEFGSGVSTVIMAKTLAKVAGRRQGKPPVEFVSFDHLEQYYQQTLARLKHAGLAETVQLTLAPLQDYAALNGNTYPYYDCQKTLAALAQRHLAAGLRLLVIVDGPPAATGKHARYPAAPIVLTHFKSAQIDLLLDDYIRDDEKEIAQLWQAEFSAANLRFTVTERKLEKDACLLTLNPNAGKEAA